MFATQSAYHFEFQHIIDSVRGMDLLRAFCCADTEQSVNSLDFIVKCQELRQLEEAVASNEKVAANADQSTVSKRQQVQQLAKEIFETFIVENSPHSIDMSPALRKIVTRRYSEAAAAALPSGENSQEEAVSYSSLFEQPLRASILLLKTLTFPRFTRSKQFLTALQAMKHSEITSEFKGILKKNELQELQQQMDLIQLKPKDLIRCHIDMRDFKVLYDMSRDDCCQYDWKLYQTNPVFNNIIKKTKSTFEQCNFYLAETPTSSSSSSAYSIDEVKPMINNDSLPSSSSAISNVDFQSLLFEASNNIASAAFGSNSSSSSSSLSTPSASVKIDNFKIMAKICLEVKNATPLEVFHCMHASNFIELSYPSHKFNFVEYLEASAASGSRDSSASSPSSWSSSSSTPSFSSSSSSSSSSTPRSSIIAPTRTPTVLQSPLFPQVYSTNNQNKRPACSIITQQVVFPPPAAKRVDVTCFSAIYDPKSDTVMMIFKSCEHTASLKQLLPINDSSLASLNVRMRMFSGVTYQNSGNNSCLVTCVGNMHLGGWIGSTASYLTKFLLNDWSKDVTVSIQNTVNHYLQHVKPNLISHQQQTPIGASPLPSSPSATVIPLPGFEDKLKLLQTLADNIQNKITMNMMS